MRDAKPLEEIRSQGKTLAIILRANFRSDTLSFFSPADFSQQLGYLPHKAGKVIPAHFHRRVQREITLTQEVLFIRSGRVRATLYDEDREFVASLELGTGDLIFLCSGGHGFEVLEDSEIIEVKQGPYSGRDSDKIVFESHGKDTGQ